MWNFNYNRPLSVPSILHALNESTFIRAFPDASTHMSMHTTPTYPPTERETEPERDRDREKLSQTYIL